MENLNNTYTNFPSKGLITDLDSALMGKDVWSHMRNGSNNTHKGNSMLVSNEPANKYCVDFPYTPIGFIKILNNKWIVFTTDNFNSEIGIFNEKECTYEKLVNNRCLNFNTASLITGVSKENFDCTETIYWTDGQRNPRRRLKLNNIPYKYTLNDDACQTKDFTQELDCNALLVSPKITVPQIEAIVSGTGNIKNGTYQFGIAYTINKQRITEYYSITSPQSIFSHQNLGQSITLNINNLDRDFDQYELIVIYNVNNTSTAKILGYYSTSTTVHQVTSVERPEYLSLPFEEIITKRPYYYYADSVVNNDQYLLWSGVTSRPELNYQLQAFEIQTKWVAYKVKQDYYAQNGNLVGYLRGEVYSFGIQWLYDNGEWSSVFHIPGRESLPKDTSIASGKDVFEAKVIDETKPARRYFEIFDTSTKEPASGLDKDAYNIVIARGDMSYHESTELYPTNVEQFGEWACTPIRHHKMPDECQAPRHQQLGQYINLLGVEFNKIPHPKDKDGNEIEGIVGYRIVRGDREGNRSVIARGMLTNVRTYEETNADDSKRLIRYTNYPYNDLRPDSLISSEQTYNSNRGENKFRALSGYKSNEFNFYAPHALFGHVGLGDELLIETEESSTVRGFYEYVYNHPKFKFLDNSVFWLAITLGAIDGVLSLFGKRCVSGLKSGIVNVTNVGPPPSNVTITAAGMTTVTKCEDLVNGLPWADLIHLPAVEAVAKGALKVVQYAAKAGMAIAFAYKTANEFLDMIYSLQKFKDYAVQYNSHGFFNSSSCMPKDNKRRKIEFYQYLYSGINTVEGNTFNNYGRENSVYMRLSSDVTFPKVVDNSRVTIASSGTANDIGKEFTSTASAYYGTVKRSIVNQYGQLDAVRYLATSGKVLPLEEAQPEGSSQKYYNSGPTFGGDTYINRMTIKRSHRFFRQDLSDANYPDGTEYNYTLYRNIGYPRFWVNSERWDISNVLVAGTIPNRMPNGRYNLDYGERTRSLRLLNLKGVRGYFHLYNSGVLDFFVESDYNLDRRDYSTDIPSYYSNYSSNLTELFRSDRIKLPEEFLYDFSYSKELKENALFQQALNYDPDLSESCFSYYKNRVIYSLPSSKDDKGDNWLVYLTNNYYDFPLSNFGSLTSMHSVDNQQIIFLFDKSAPYITIGRDELQTDGGVKITIGDSGLFAREPRPIAYTDYFYGNSQSSRAFVNTQYGSFYVSQRQGRIFNWRGQLDEISAKGNHWWFKNYLPSKLLEQFPNFQHKDNPHIGVGVTSVFDNTNGIYYLTKTDYSLKPIWRGIVTYDGANFRHDGTKIDLKNTTYFHDAGFTISYDAKQQIFLGWHDWNPEFTLQGEKHFLTVKGKTAWKHNERTDLFCNFYGIDYPFEIEFIVNNGQNSNILRSVEWVADFGKYFNDGIDYHTILDEGFDRAIISNHEQISGNLILKIGPKNKMSELLEKPYLTFDGFEVKYNKEENKYRLNQFFDITKDRGEFTNNNFPLWTTMPNGYIKQITDTAVNYQKNQFQQKKFRGLWHKIFLSKTISGANQIIFKISNAKQTYSPS